MQTKNTANKEEINKFDKLAEEWWNPNGKFAPLHKFNPVRQEYLIDQISNHFNLNLGFAHSLFKHNSTSFLSLSDIIDVSDSS